MHTALFEHASHYDEDALVALARDSELDVERFRAELQSEAVDATLAAHREAATVAGVALTPSV